MSSDNAEVERQTEPTPQVAEEKAPEGNAGSRASKPAKAEKAEKPKKAEKAEKPAKAEKSSSSGSGNATFATVAKWCTLIACLVMVVILLIAILSSSGTIGSFAHILFYVVWLLLQGLVDFGVGPVEGLIANYFGFMLDHIFRGSMLIVVAMIFCPQYWGNYWYLILQNIGSLLLMVAGVIEIVFGALETCGKK